jgi:hypothetical protein
VEYPPQSPDLTLLNFYLRFTQENTVYAIKPRTLRRTGSTKFILLVLLIHQQQYKKFQSHYSENLVAPGIETGTCGSDARNSDHWTTEAEY